MNTQRNPLTLADIEAKAKNYSTARGLLADRLHQLEAQLQALKDQALPLIKGALQAAKAAESELSGTIQLAPHLFKKPRTVVFYDVRCGIEKGKGKLVINDQEQCIRLIEKHLPDQVELLVKTTRTPIKAAISQLQAADLKRIGATLLDAGDQVVIRPVDGALEKMLNALLKADTTEVEEGERD